MLGPLLLALALVGQGATYYADGRPGNGSGTAADPFHLDDFPAMVGGQRSPSFFDALRAGDTVRLRGVIDLSARVAVGMNAGLGASPLIAIPPVGLAGSPVVVESDPGQVATLTASPGDQCLVGVHTRRGATGHVRLSGFRVLGGLPSDPTVFSGGSTVVGVWGGFPDGTGPTPALGGIVLDRLEVAYAARWPYPGGGSSNHQCINIQGTVGAIVRGCAVHDAGWSDGREGHASGLLGYWNLGTLIEDSAFVGDGIGVLLKDAGRVGRPNLERVVRCYFGANEVKHISGYLQSEKSVYGGSLVYGSLVVGNCLLDGSPAAAAIDLGGISDGSAVKNCLFRMPGGGVVIRQDTMAPVVDYGRPVPASRVAFANNIITTGGAPFILWRGTVIPWAAQAPGPAPGSPLGSPFGSNDFDGPATYVFPDGRFAPDQLAADPSAQACGITPEPDPAAAGPCSVSIPVLLDPTRYGPR